ncbi:MAG: hypothetical protein LBV68_01390 [Spirochaetaceae bacterium]|jgi:hypothetical protein|nr:hypothetical protein [Spirochaetaceae bacterium]
MRKRIGLIVLAAVFTCPILAETLIITDGSVGSLAANQTEVQVKSTFFDISFYGGVYETDLLLKELELRFAVYNRLFRFDVSLLPGPLKVRVFSDKSAYDRYLISQLGQTKEGAVYLHYNQADKRELVIHAGSPEAERVLPEQAFVQFLRAFISYPPSWMRDGFMIYFNTLKFNKETKDLVYEENLAWLEFVKKLAYEHREPQLQSIFLADVNGQTPEYFQAMSWALVSFFLNTGGNGDYFRSLTESFLLLLPNGSAAENDQVVLTRLSNWAPLSTIYNDYKAYIASRQTFNELLESGQKAYAANDYTLAEAEFLKALWQKPNHYAAYYYLGLLAYTQKNYDMAARYYRSALGFGADEALIQYALGVNAASAGNTDEAYQGLYKAAALAPERYRARVDEIIGNLRVTYPANPAPRY